MRRLCRVPLFLTLSAILFCAACGPEASGVLSQEEIQWLAERNNTIRISPAADYPPISFLEPDGTLSGIAADYLSLLEKKLGVRFIAGEGASDGISAVVRVPDTAGSGETLFSAPYVESPAIILTRQTVRETLSLPQLKGMNVGIVEGDAAGSLVGSRYSDIPVTEVESGLRGIRDLSAGRIDAFITDLKVASYYIEREEIQNLRVAGEAGFSYPVSFGCSAEEPILVGILDKGLSLITDSERFSVEKRWGSRLDMPGNGQYWSAALVFLGFGSAAAIFIFFLLRPDISIKQKGGGGRGEGRRIGKALRNFLVFYWPVYIILILAGALSVGIYVSSMLEDRALTESELDWLGGHREGLVLAADPAWPPFGYFDENGEYRGLSAEYVGAVEKSLGIVFTKRPAAPDDADMIAAAPMTDEISSRFLFTEPYYEIPMVIIVRKSFEGDISLERPGEYRIAAARGHPAADLVAEGYPDIDLVSVPDLVTGLRMVSFDEVDGMIMDIASALSYIDEEGITNLRVAGNTGIVYELRFAVSRDLPVLCSAVSKALASIGDKERRQINGRWIRAEQRGVLYNRKILYGAGTGLVLVLFIVIVVLLWNWTLREQVHNHTLALEEELRRRTVAEKELQILNSELERRVTERTKALEEALDRQKEIQSQLVQTEKLAALGELVAGVAHEINTPVGVAVTAVSHMMTKTEKISLLFDHEEMKKSDLGKYLETVGRSSSMILKNLLRAGDLIRSFKQVAVDQTSDERRVFNVKKYLSEIFLSLDPKLRKTNYTVSIDCPEDLAIESFPGAFSQVMTNFVVNSLMHGFEGRPVGAITVQVTLQGGWIRLIYADNGNGMDPEIIPRIFDPFFTTKRGKGGSGLGLHIVYNLVTQILGGTIRCESSPGMGASFVLLIPVKRFPSPDR